MSTMRGIPKSEMSRRVFCQLLGVGASTVVLSACGGSGSSGPPTLNFWTPGGSTAFCDAHNSIAKTYEKSQKNVRMAPVKCGSGQQDYNEVLLARIAAGNPPDATVLWDTPVSLGGRGALIEMDELMAQSKHAKAENWPQGVLASSQFGGKTYGLPVAAGTYAFWFNQELFTKKGIPSKREDFPKTWQELRNLSKEFTVWEGNKLVSAGYIPSMANKDTLPIWAALNGSQIYDAANQKYTIDAEPNVEMMEFFLSWLNEEYKGDLNAIGASGSWGAYPGTQGQPPAFQQQRLAMMMEGSWIMGDFYASVKPEFEQWEVASLPIGPSGSKTVSGAWPNWIVMPKGSKNKEETFKYLDYISGEGIETWFKAVPDLPTNKNAPTDMVPTTLAEKRGQEFAQATLDFFRQQLDIVTPMWDSPIQNYAADTFQRTLEQIFKKATKPGDALKAAQKTCQERLESFLRDKK